ncbi:MAG: hypothetical protein IT381_23020 [Deltaproteobacteria bacterium]|nr:hypothetical protein [Deltaproteobacteria bacterium]
MLLLTLLLFARTPAVELKDLGFRITYDDASGGTMHKAKRVVLAITDELGTRKTTLDVGDGGLPLFTRALALPDGYVLVLGWMSGGSGLDVHVAWLIATDTMDPPLVVDTLYLFKARSGPSLAYDETGAFAFFYDDPCPRDPDLPQSSVRSLRGGLHLLCKLPAQPSTATWKIYEDAPSVKKAATLRLVVRVKDGAFVVQR